MKKILVIALVQLLLSDAFAQIYSVGNDGGFDMQCYMQQDIPSAEIYYVGSENSIPVSCYLQATPPQVSIYSVGNDMGISFSCYIQPDIIPVSIYSVGIDNGYFYNCYLQPDIIPQSIYSVGQGDGFTFSCYEQLGLPPHSIYFVGFDDGFSFSCGGTVDEIPLPVELIYFIANCGVDMVYLSWATASETNNNYFTIEYSNGSSDFIPIGTVHGNGNSNQTEYYSFADVSPLYKQTYYRLKQTDFNGKTQISGMVNVICNPETGIFVYPNPSQGVLFIESNEENYSVMIHNILGEIVHELKSEDHHSIINITDQPNGIYFVKIITPTQIISRKIILEKK